MAEGAEVVVAGHVSLDVFPALEGPVGLEPGRLVVVGPAVFSTGGVVCNTGLALHRLGVRTRLVGKLGADLFGRAVLEALRAREPGLADGLVTAADQVTSYTIVINPPNLDRSFLHCPGANETFGAEDVPYDELPGVRVLHFGYPPLMPRMWADAGAQLRTMFERVHRAGPATSLDLCVPDPGSEAGRVDWPAVLANALPFVDVFAPSIDELLFMFDRPAHERLVAGEPLAAVVDRARLRELSGTPLGLGAAVVAIKLGDQGLYLRTASDGERIARWGDRIGLDPRGWRGREVLSPCFAPEQVAGTTGSGDATIAGLLAAILRGAPAPEAATIATAVGACSVEAIDPVSAIPAWPELVSRMAGGWARRPAELELGIAASGVRDATGTVVLA